MNRRAKDMVLGTFFAFLLWATLAEGADFHAGRADCSSLDAAEFFLPMRIEETSSWVMVGHGVLAPAWHQREETDSE
jgi:hypothetical protein